MADYILGFMVCRSLRQPYLQEVGLKQYIHANAIYCSPYLFHVIKSTPCPYIPLHTYINEAHIFIETLES